MPLYAQNLKGKMRKFGHLCSVMAIRIDSLPWWPRGSGRWPWRLHCALCCSRSSWDAWDNHWNTQNTKHYQARFAYQALFARFACEMVMTTKIVKRLESRGKSLHTMRTRSVAIHFFHILAIGANVGNQSALIPCKLGSWHFIVRVSIGGLSFWFSFLFLSLAFLAAFWQLITKFNFRISFRKISRCKHWVISS